jgi:hypothetical protein
MVCEAFECSPSEALEQDYTLVQAILDYRGAKLAVDLFDQEGGVAKLHENPGLLSALAMMQRAQDGVELWGGDLEAEGKAVVSERAN